MLYSNGGQTAAREPHVALFKFYCGSIKKNHKYFLLGFEHIREQEVQFTWCPFSTIVFENKFFPDVALKNFQFFNAALSITKCGHPWYITPQGPKVSLSCTVRLIVYHFLNFYSIPDRFFLKHNWTVTEKVHPLVLLPF